MKKLLSFAGFILGASLLFASSVSATSTLLIQQGGTSSTTLSGILVGNGSTGLSAAINTLTVGTGLTLTGTTLTSSGTPGGLNTQVQYNNAGVFGGVTGATTNGTILSLTNPLLGGATLTTSVVNGVTLTTAGSATSYLNATGAYTVPVGTVYTATFPIQVSGTVISSLFGTTTNNGMAQGFLYSGSGGIWQTAASSSLFGYTPLNPTRNINTTAPLGGGGALTSDLTLTCTSCSTFAYPFTPSTFGINVSATSTPILDYPGLIAATSTFGTVLASSSITDQLLGTPAGTFIAADPTGKLIATTTPSGSNSAFSPAANYGTVTGLPSYTATAGVITEVGTGALSVDGNNPTIGQIVLVKNESGTCTSSGGTCQNGLYNVTAAGSGIAAFVLTRNSNYNSSSNVIPGIVTYIISGATLADDFWALTTPSPITVGTTGLTYVEVSGGGAGVVSVANSDSTLTISPTTGNVIASLNLAHANTWSVLQTFGNATSSLFSTTYGSTTLGFIGTLTLSTTTAGCLNTNATGIVYAATCSSGSSFAYPFTFGTTFATGTAATTTSIWLQGGSLFSSSTVASQIPYASTTALTAGTSAANRISLGVDASGFGSLRTLGGGLDIATDGSHTININTAGTGNAQLSTSLLSTDRQFQFPDVPGTICLTVTCDTFAFPFTPATNYNVNFNATTTPIWIKNPTVGNISFAASSTAAFDQIQVGSSTVSTMATSTFFGNVSIVGNASSTGLTVSGTRNALLLAGGVGSVSAYGGGTCTSNQFATAITATGGCTSAAVTGAFFGNVAANTVFGNFTGASAVPTFTATSSLFTIGAGLTQNANTLGLTIPVVVSSGGTNATSFSGNNLIYANSAGTTLTNVGSATTTTGVANDILALSAIGKTVITYASTTAATIASEVNIPNSGTVPTLFAGDVYINTNSVASSSIAFATSQQNNLFAVHSVSSTFASSTLAYDGLYGASGTTTLRVSNPLHKTTMVNIYCLTDVGTAWVGFGTGSATTTEVQCSATGATAALSTNNVWNGRQTIFMEIGRNASAPNNITVTTDLEDSN